MKLRKQLTKLTLDMDAAKARYRLVTGCGKKTDHWPLPVHKVPLCFCFLSLQNSFTVEVSSKLAVEWCLKFLSHVESVSTLPCEMCLYTTLGIVWHVCDWQWRVVQFFVSCCICVCRGGRLYKTDYFNCGRILGVMSLGTSRSSSHVIWGLIWVGSFCHLWLLHTWKFRPCRSVNYLQLPGFYAL